MGQARRFAKNSLALTVTSLTVAVLGAVYRIYIARYLGDADFGRYTFIITVAGYFLAFAQFGFRQVVTREVANKPEKARAIVFTAFRLRLWTTIPSMLGLVMFSQLVNKGSTVENGLLVYGASILFVTVTDLLEGVFVGKQEAHYAAIGAISSTLVKVFLGIYLLQRGVGLVGLLFMFTLASALNTLIAVWFVRKHLRAPVGGEDHDPGLRKFILKESLPFFYLGLANSRGTYKSDVLILSFLVSEAMLGWYGAARLPVDFILLIGGSIGAASYPILTQAHSVSHEQLAFLYRTFCRAMVVLFLPMAVGLTFAGTQIMCWVFGPDFTMAGSALAILVWMAVPEALNVTMGTLLAAMYEQRVTARLGIMSAILSIVLVVPLGAMWNIMGASAGVVASSVVTTFVANYAVKKRLAGVDWLDALTKPVLAGICMALVIQYTLSNKIIACVFSIPVYAAALLLLKAFTPREMDALRSLLPRRKNATKAL